MANKAKPDAIGEIQNEQSWTVAKQLAGVLGPMPSYVTDSIKDLWKNYSESKENPEAVPDEDCFRAIRMIESASKLRTPLYHAALKLRQQPSVPVDDKNAARILLEMLKPGLFSVLLGMVYLHKRIAKLSTSEEWPKLAKDLMINMELGYQLGLAAPVLGEAEGLLAGAIRYYAFATYLIVKPADYMKFRRQSGKKIDPQFEQEFWGCDHSQIASYLLSMLGYRKDIAEVGQALRKSGKPSANLPEQLQVWRSSLFFIDHLKSGVCPPPEPSHAPKLGLTTAAACDALRLKALRILEEGSSFDWLLKTSKED